ncbi:MAG: DUF4982 domain-containing protein [Lachnospiraceae bacterium]|jgi:beta-galactosidase|nr:DUF4982 domain-containing protein [Lachnospiraceae bacterium]
MKEKIFPVTPSLLLNDGWEFALDDGALAPAFTPVQLPHDWLIYDTMNLYKDGTGRYRRRLSPQLIERGQRLFINFDGVYMDTTLFLNDQKVGEWKYGYTAFEFELTSFWDYEKENTLLVEVCHQSPNSRWYSGAGIYRDVTLKVKNDSYFINDGIYISTAKKDGLWRYDVTAEVASGGRPYTVRHTLYEFLGEDGISFDVANEIANGSDAIKTWDIDSPHLYVLFSELIIDDTVVDTAETRFGFREIAFDPDEAFSLNGRRMKLYGVCQHHDLGALGAAMNKAALRRQLDLLRGMGVNAIRTAHNPPAKVFMELADEMGFLVLSELLDMWEQPKTKFDYARFFHEWVERDTAAWIRRDRNSPSVIMWSVGNEIYDTHASVERGSELLTLLMGYIKEHDPKGHAPATICSNYMAWENTQKCVELIKLVGYNYAEILYASHHETFPDWIIYGGETASHVQSRGIYRFPLTQSVLAEDDFQCSVLGNCSTSWGSENPEKCALDDENAPFSLGTFIWTGTDYIGEPTPYHTKNSYFGQIDTAGFHKDSYYVYKAAWTKEPMIHIYPHWDHSPGFIVDVRAATNAARAELFLNGESQGSVDMTGRYVADWRVPYQAGELSAVAYDETGQIVAKTSRHSFGDVAKLKVETDIYDELSFVMISAVDEDGNEVANASNRVRVTVEGGTLLGMDNGDSTDFEQYKTDNRRMFAGKLLAIVSQDDPDNPPLVTAAIDESDIPIRKIEITLEGYKAMVQTFPANATYDELEWRLTDSAGIDSPLGTLIVADDHRSAVIEPCGDGELWVRCATRNGRDHIVLISQVMLQTTGYGVPFLNPYNFVTGGLADRSNVKLGNGNERGIVSARDGDSYIGYSNLDFGSFGSDELIVPIFPLSHDPFDFEIWEGMPDEAGAERLAIVHYDLKPIWNTYQELKCQLSRRIRGVKTLCFVMRGKVHVKGFVFTRYEKAFMRLNAADNDGISGDSYTVKDTAVVNIGNNVSIVFTAMDFGEGGAGSITLSTRSALKGNSVQLMLDDRREMLEISGTADYTATTHPLSERVCGEKTVSLVFLPGSDIDVEWIEFGK